MHPTHIPARLALCAPLLAPAASAQVLVHASEGAVPGDTYGAALGVVGDLDGDGVRDLWVGAPRADFGVANGGSAYARSGQSGMELFRVDGLGQGGLLGSAVAGFPDVNGDGIDDLVAGAPLAQGGGFLAGEVHAWSGASGAPLWTAPGLESFGLFGSALAGVGDTNGDGVPDVLVGAPGHDANGIDSGSLLVLSGASGALFWSAPGLGAGDALGTAVCGLGDLDGDGLIDVVAGAPLADLAAVDSGGAICWSVATGLVLFTASGGASGDRFGQALADLGDVNGDGKHDLAVGAPYDGFAGVEAGSVAVLSGATGLSLYTRYGLPGERYGACVAAAGDVDGDGVGDLIVGGPAGNRCDVRSGVDGALLYTLPAPADAADFGRAAAGGLDVDGDGHAEVAVGDPQAANHGRVSTFSDHPLAGTPFCEGTDAACPCGNGGAPDAGCANSTGPGAALTGLGTASVALDELVLAASGMTPNQPALLFAGQNAVNGGAGTQFGDGLRCAGGGVQRLGVHAADASGAASWGPGLVAQQGWSAGATWRLQAWYRDPAGSPCGSAFNLSNGFEVVLVP